MKSDNSHYSIIKDQKLLSTVSVETSTLNSVELNAQLLTLLLRHRKPRRGYNQQSQIGNALVEVRGVEPLTPWLQTMCSAN